MCKKDSKFNSAFVYIICHNNLYLDGLTTLLLTVHAKQCLYVQACRGEVLVMSKHTAEYVILVTQMQECVVAVSYWRSAGAIHP